MRLSRPEPVPPETDYGPADEDLVWHYTDGAGLLSMVRNHVLWSTASAFLNDAQEVEVGYRRILEVLPGRLRSEPELRELFKHEMSRAQRDHDGPSPGTFFILSAAAHWDLLAMWRCYGGLGESYAIGLDRTAPLRILCDPGSPCLDRQGGLVRTRPWTPVRYTESQQRALAEAVFDGLTEELSALRARVTEDGAVTTALVEEELSETLDDLEQALVLVKHEGFSDEREVRHTISLIPERGESGWPGLVRYRATAYGMAPYLWLTGDDGSGPLATRPVPLPIRAVAISPSPNGPAAEASLRELLAAHGYPVDVRRSRIPFRG